MRELLVEIDKFKNWAKTVGPSGEWETEYPHYGEWETEYPHWGSIYDSVNQLVEDIPVERWRSDLINAFLYILARDNESEFIIDTLIDNPIQLLSVAKHALSYPDYDARWQIAYGLGEIDENNQEIQMLLNQFLLDEIEYVRRRASFAYEKKGF